MPRIALLTPEERLERKRLAERLRMEKIRSDPDQYAQWTAKRRESYSKKKELGPVKEEAPISLPMWQQQLQKQAVKAYKRRRMSRKITKKNTEDAQLNEVEMKSDSIDALSNHEHDPLNENSDEIPLPSPSSHMDSRFNQEEDIIKPIPAVYYTECSDQDVHVKLEPYSPGIDSEPLIPQISIHECPEPLVLNTISPETLYAPEKSSSQPKVSNESPWSLFREFECSIRKELDSKDKIIEELKLLNDKYIKQIKLLSEEKIKSSNKCPYCDRQIK